MTGGGGEVRGGAGRAGACAAQPMSSHTSHYKSRWPSLGANNTLAGLGQGYVFNVFISKANT